MAERTLQQLDPLGALISRPITYIAAVCIPVYAAICTLNEVDELESGVLAIVALMAITASCIVLLLKSSPLRAPFTVSTHAIVTGLAVVAYLVSALAKWDTNTAVRDDWGPIALGFVLLALSQYRPSTEIAKVGLFLALFAGVLALLQAHSLTTPVPPIVYSLVTMMPILAFSLAAAFFNFELVTGLDSWRSNAATAVTSFGVDNSGWIARSVQQDRVTILNRDVVPFFARVLHAGAVDDADSARAKEIASAIRAVMVAEVDRSWIDLVLSQLPGVSPHALDDPGHVASAMATEQRTALRALLVAIAASPRYVAGSLVLSLRTEKSSVHSRLSAELSSADSAFRWEFSPFFAVMRIMFPDLRVESSGATVTLRFSYGR